MPKRKHPACDALSDNFGAQVLPEMGEEAMAKFDTDLERNKLLSTFVIYSPVAELTPPQATIRSLIKKLENDHVKPGKFLGGGSNTLVFSVTNNEGRELPDVVLRIALEVGPIAQDPFIFQPVYAQQEKFPDSHGFPDYLQAKIVPRGIGMKLDDENIRPKNFQTYMQHNVVAHNLDGSPARQFPYGDMVHGVLRSLGSITTDLDEKNRTRKEGTREHILSHLEPGDEHGEWMGLPDKDGRLMVVNNKPVMGLVDLGVASQWPERFHLSQTRDRTVADYKRQLQEQGVANVDELMAADRAELKAAVPEIAGRYRQIVSDMEQAGIKGAKVPEIFDTPAQKDSPIDPANIAGGGIKDIKPAGHPERRGGPPGVAPE